MVREVGWMVVCSMVKRLLAYQERPGFQGTFQWKRQFLVDDRVAGSTCGSFPADRRLPGSENPVFILISREASYAARFAKISFER